MTSASLVFSVVSLRADEPGLERRIDDISDVPAEARLALFEAQQHRDEGDPQAAVDALVALLHEHPDMDHFLVRFHLAASWARRGDLEEALLQYERSVQMEPRFAQGWLNLGELSYNLGRYDLAASALLTGYETSEWKEPSVLFFAAAALVMDGRAEEAVPALETLVSGEHGDPKLEWHRALLMACLDLEDGEGGRAAVDRMLRQYGESADAWRLAFRYSAATGDYEQAAVALIIGGFLRELSLDEEMTLGDLLLAAGVPSRAAGHYEHALADSGSTQDLERLASAHLAAYEFDDALIALNRALAQEPTAQLWSLLGDLNFMSKEYESAFDAYANCVASDTTFARGYLMMGYCAMQLDRMADAIPPLERAARFPEQSGKASQLLAALRSLTEE
jgi:tetratricopeptide (TPR) repeat protein